jgi:hypothetical protein
MAMLTHCIALFVGYCLASVVEWALHKYCMHATSTKIVPTQAFKKIRREHLVHHKDTKFDMTQHPASAMKPHLKFKKWLFETVGFPQYYQLFVSTSVDTLDIVKLVSFDGLKHEIGIYKYGHLLKIFDEIQKLKSLKFKSISPVETFQGLYFEWGVSIVICLSFLFGSIIVNFLLLIPVSHYYAIIYGQIWAVYMIIVWNYIHPTQHLQPSLSMSDGLDLIPRFEWIENTFIYSWLWQNHVFHHLLTHSNYNVTLPGADWVFGTYKTHCKGYTVDMINKTITKTNNNNSASKPMQMQKKKQISTKNKFITRMYYAVPFSVILVWDLVFVSTIS